MRKAYKKITEYLQNDFPINIKLIDNISNQ